MMRYVLVVLMLAGCATAENRIAQYGPFCEGLGYRLDTDQWRNCIQTEHANRIAASQRSVQILQQGQQNQQIRNKP